MRILRYLVFFSWLLLCFIVCFHVGNSDPRVYNCYSTNTDTAGLTTSRIKLGFLLSTSGTNDFNHFNSTSVYLSGETFLFGSYLCRGDVSNSDCQKCVATASNDILRFCPNGTKADFWYDDCMLRYSNESIFSRLEERGAWIMWNPHYVTNNTLLSQVLVSTFEQIADRAANNVSGKKFAFQEANLTSYSKIYALGQCTPDLSILDCGTCLSDAISNLPKCCTNRPGGRVLFPSCNIRYESSPFYQVPAPTPEPTPNSPAPSSPHLSGSAKEAGASFDSRKSRILIRSLAIAIPLSVCILLFIISTFLIKRRSTNRLDANRQDATERDHITINPASLQYSLIAVKIATNNFSAENKIGQGGFGGVYKGKLQNGECIAVKRLSRSSGQGAVEFKNEIGVVLKLQHKNLVRLLGFCLEGEEKIVVYEFVSNRSLDYFLFDPEKQGLLNWSRRYNIMGGIARGLLYLHENSRLKIVHRDLKAANILLDQSMEPKIADFGMAKICGVNESEGNTTRIAGTFGYMAPEYRRSGQYSVKSDVFSFGVVVLEIITGKKNSSFYQSEASEDLISYALRQWRDCTPLGLLDPTIGDCYVKNEVIQSVHIGLSCVEEDPEKRPTMASVVYMLNSTSVSLPTLHRPAVRCQSRLESLDLELGFDRANAELAQASITEPYPR